jgi:hypothetical protein
MPEDPTPYIEKSDKKINKPATCAVTGEKINLSNGDLVYLNSDYRPLSSDNKERAEYIASVQRAVGHPWNGIHPKTGETQSLDSTTWWNLRDMKKL